MRQTIIALVVLWAGLSSQAIGRTTTNRWQGGDGKWETKNQWSLNQIPNSNQDIVVANTGTFTVTIDNQTASNFPGTLTVSSLSMSNTAGSSILLLTNSPTSTIPITLTISNSAIVGAGSMLDLVDASSVGAGVFVQASNFVADTTLLLASNATVFVTNSFLIGSAPSRTGMVSVVGGTLIANPSVGSGTLLTSNGVLQASFVDVGVVSNAHGLWQIAGGSNSISGGVSIGVAAGATGDVVVANGELSSSGSISVGVQGVGRLATSNGFLQTGELDLGLFSGGHGIWQIAGGSNAINSIVYIGKNIGATGEVFVTGGDLAASFMALGGNGGSSASAGSLVISNGVASVNDLYFSYGVGGVGTITVAGGTLNIGDNVYVGYYGTGTLWLAGGEIDVTNPNQFSGLIRLVGETGGTYLGQLVCSGGVLRAAEVDVGHPFGPTSSGSSSWIIAGGTSIVSRAVYVTNRPNHTGLLSISGGLLQTPYLDVGTLSGGGSVIVSGGEVQVTHGLDVGVARGLVSELNVAGGQMDVTGETIIGDDGAGQIIVSSGTLNSSLVVSMGLYGGATGTLTVTGGAINTPLLVVGESPGSLGILTITGGIVNATVNGPNAMDLGRFPGSTGIVQYAGGKLNAPSITVGDQGYGSFTVSSNADLPQFVSLVVGSQSGAVGEMSIQGGALFGSPTRQVGYLQIGVAAGSTGTVWVTDGALQASGSCSYPAVGEQGSGRLSVTNSILDFRGLSVGSQGTFECVNSQFTVGYSCPVSNSNLILFVNSKGFFTVPVQNTDSIVANTSTLTFYGMVNNSGLIVLTNGTAQFLGGINNTGAVLFGPDKFLITSVSTTGSDVAISWQAFTGNHYRVQAANSLTDSFFDISSDIVPTGSGLGTTNYVGSGAATNAPGRFYRIRHVY